MMTKRETSAFLKRLKKLKKDLGLVSDSALARFTGTPKGTICDWMAGRRSPTEETAESLEVRLRDLLTDLDVQSKAIREFLASGPKNECIADLA